MKLLITGVAGFIGFSLTKCLLEKRIDIVGIDSINNYYSTKLKLDRLKILTDYDNFNFYAINICNKDELDELFKNEDFDMVINLAAQAGVRYSIEKPYKYLDSNLIGFINILEACRNYDVTDLIYASSSSVYGKNREIPFTTSQNTDKPVSLYAATKKANELMAHAYSELYNIKATGLRFFTVYGPWGRPDMAYYAFSANIDKNIPIQIFNNGDLERDFTYIDDIVSGISNLVIKYQSLNYRYKVYNLGNNRPVSISSFIKQLELNIGKKAIIEYLPMQPGDVKMTYADITDAQKDFDYNPTTNIENGLSDFVKWYYEYNKKDK